MADEEVEELTLDSTKIKLDAAFKETLERFVNLASLSMNDCDLRNLENFPTFPNLIRLELIDNKLHGKTLKPL